MDAQMDNEVLRAANDALAKKLTEAQAENERFVASEMTASTLMGDSLSEAQAALAKANEEIERLKNEWSDPATGDLVEALHREVASLSRGREDAKAGALKLTEAISVLGRSGVMATEEALNAEAALAKANEEIERLVKSGLQREIEVAQHLAKLNQEIDRLQAKEFPYV